ncbi:MAG: carboxypeptidase regulatory-like domain-containing protein [Acidobacteria bacterium]|nr:carboxypeptidase regulatory-like domain-containing protein [Acidobacteriota bacterium]
MKLTKAGCWTVMVCLLAALMAPPADAQVASTGAIFGNVTDPSGAAVPEARITIISSATGVTREITSNVAGFYSAESLLAGSYAVTIAKAGFQQTIIKDLVLTPGQRLQNNVALQVGAVETQISVEAEAIRVETESGESAGVITSSYIDNLLLNGRNFLGLALLIPGVNSATITGRAVGGGSLNNGGLTGETPLSINGLGREYTNYTIDGSYNMNTGNNININVTPPLDTIAEFRLLKDNYSAKYGVAGSAQVLVETKSGSRVFHGGLYDFLRNDKVDASNFFSGGNKTPLRQNNFGFALGGPVMIPGLYNKNRDKQTFFFVNEEWRVNHSGLTLRAAMIPEAMRNGDFSNSPTFGSKGNQLVFDDTAQRLLAGRGNCLLSPTQLNSACFDPNSVAIMNRYWPLPNNPGAGFLNYINPGVDKINQRNDTYRIDHYFGSRLVLMGRWMYEDVLDAPPALVWGPNAAPTTSQSIFTTGLNALLRLTANITPTIVNTTSLVQTHDKPRLRAKDAELPSDININYAFQNADIHHRIPEVSIAGGWNGLGVFPLPVDASDGEWTASDDISIVKGSHVLQAGALYIWGIKRQNLFSQTNGAFSFSGVHSNDPVADFLLGLDSSYFQTSGERRGYFHYRQFEPYFHDDWKVTPKLTLNLGLRYVYISPDTIDGDGVTSFDANRFDPTKAPAVTPDGLFVTNAAGQIVTASGQPADLQNGLIFAGKNGVPRGFFNATKRNFAPRIGFAWDPFGNGKTSIRGGYGIGYSRIPFDNYIQLNNPPFIDSTTLINGTLTNPAAGVAGAKSPTGVSMVDPTFQPTRVQTWSFTIQREVAPAAVVSIAYVGSGTRHVKGTQDINFPLPVSQPSTSGCLQPGQASSGGFDFDPCLNTGKVSATFTRPYSGWTGLSDPFTGGTSNYHSLQTGFQYKKSALTWNVAYTFGKVLTNVADRGFDGRNSGAGAQNSRNFNADYGPPGWDRTHIFTSGYVYDLPFFKGSKGFVNKALGNWTISGITVIESGFALSPGLATGTNGLASRPDLIGTVAGPKTLGQWFNTGAFAAPAYGFFGNAGTGLIRGPGENTWNVALFKAFPFNERTRLRFRAEAFNLWNHPSFSAVSTAVGAGNYGQVTTALEPRIMEFSLRLDF